MAEENSDIDDWLNDLDDEEQAPGEELDQADIDSLLGGDTEAQPEAAASEAASEAAAPADELDQSDVDALLGGDSEEAAPADDAAGETESAAEPEPVEELDQADIDSLLGTEEDAGEEGGTLDQEEMDQLFAEAADDGDSGLEGADQVDFAEILGDDSEVAAAEEESAFDADAFALNDDEETVMERGAGTFVGPGGVATGTGEVEPWYRRRLVQMAAGMAVVLLVGVSVLLYLLRGGGEKPLAIDENAPPTPPEKVLPQPTAANTPPMVKADLYRMSRGGGEIPIALSGYDADGDTIAFEIVTPPAHGRLSGKAPELVYLPGKDFPGEDRFTYRGNDGKAVGEPATVFLTGPDLTASAKEVAKKATVVGKKARPGPLRARDVTLATVSTDALLLDWQQIWRRANGGSFQGVSVKIGTKGLQGRLEKIAGDRHRYQPPAFFSGREIISYQFSKGKRHSPVREVTITVALGDHQPEIVAEPVAAGYLPGQTITLDVSGSRDDRREALSFAWQQLAGVPVQLEAKNQEGSVVAFVMPSSFHDAAGGGVVMQVTVRDPGGKTSRRKFSLTSGDNRQTALWRGIPGDGVLPEPACPDGDCPGDLLPWPYYAPNP